MEGNSTDGPVGHAYGGHLVTEGCTAWPRLDGCPIWTPSSVTKAGIIEAVSEKPFTLPITQCGVQAAARRLVERASRELEARSTGSHCGGLTTAWSTSASLLARQGWRWQGLFGMKAAQKAAATLMTSARKRKVCFFAYKLRSGVCMWRNPVSTPCIQAHAKPHAPNHAWRMHGWGA